MTQQASAPDYGETMNLRVRRHYLSSSRGAEDPSVWNKSEPDDPNHSTSSDEDYPRRYEEYD